MVQDKNVYKKKPTTDNMYCWKVLVLLCLPEICKIFLKNIYESINNLWQSLQLV